MSLERAKPRQVGATLIEVMVSILILAFGVLAMIALQANAVKYSKTTEYRSMATLLANDLAERMRINPSAVAAGNYTLSNVYTLPTSVPPRTECADPKNCSTSELAARDLGEWQRAVYFALPSGRGYVQPSALNNAVDIWIAWQDPGDANGLSATSGCPAAFVQKTSSVQSLHCTYFRIGLFSQLP